MKVNYRELADLLLDYLVDGLGIIETIGFLYSRGYTKEQLLELDFSAEDIEEAILFEEGE